MLSELLPGPQLVQGDETNSSISQRRNLELYSCGMVNYTPIHKTIETVNFFTPNYKHGWNKLR